MVSSGQRKVLGKEGCCSGCVPRVQKKRTKVSNDGRADTVLNSLEMLDNGSLNTLNLNLIILNKMF
jgi:phosphopantothenate synthetase